jgi:poly-beta-1,6-N-acetyl-D-glucosamine synthase
MIQVMKLEYVLITPARNEASFIEQTLQSVVSQTVLPKRWVIVSDGSSDGTDQIVESYLPGRPWLQLIHLPDQQERNFASKARVFNVGYRAVRDLSFDVIGCLDADISFEADYFAYLLEKFRSMPSLGVAGTHYIEGSFHSYNDSYMNLSHVNGGCQLFRRLCFDAIGGYQQIRGGGIDWIAVTTARMNGWTTRSFGDRIFYHHRKIGTAESNEWISRFRYGKKDYLLGGHPLWQLCRGAFQIGKKPYFLGAFALMLGYLWCWLKRADRVVSPELMAFHRQEQLQRLRQLVHVRSMKKN